MFFFLYTSLKILAVTQAIVAFFALSKEKITTLNLGRLFSANSLSLPFFIEVSTDIFLMKTIIFILLLPCLLQGQQIYPSLSGENLLDALVVDYKPENVLDYGEARDVMYGEIYNVNDTVYGVYSGHALYLPTEVDPSIHLYMNGSSNGINAEHTYPQSKGADEDSGNPHSDLHHLFPVRTGVNTARSNSPFAEIDDNQTDNWYYKTEILNNIPNANIDDYSERANGEFEPREDHKGNVARAVFYFYTMYKEEAIEADPAFFEMQRETLCDWHLADPADDLEINRTYLIAGYQNGLPNPFIVDYTLATRSYCQHLAVANAPIPQLSPIKVYPNPVTTFLSVNARGENALLLTDILGRKLLNQQFRDEIVIDFSSFAKGTYILNINGKVQMIIK
ncbi:MAG: endonuclease I [Saprospiraceae bacterium]